MSEPYEPARVVAHGPTTRTVQLTTGERVAFAPEALHDMVRQAREGFVAMNVEHLDLLPPIGRWSDGEVKTLEDGEQQLLLYGSMLQQFETRAEFEDPFRPASTAQKEAPSRVDLVVRAEARNFDSETWSSAASDCPFPVEETHKWSALPPLEWLFSIPVVWGAARFAGSFLDRLGSAAADGLISWIKETSRRAKEPARDRYVTLAFEIEDGRTVYGFIPLTAEDDELTALRDALDRAGPLAELAGAQRDGLAMRAHRIAYFYDGATWQLGWFVTDEGVFRTKYFLDSAPDPERFLGRPLLPDGLPSERSIGGREPRPKDS